MGKCQFAEWPKIWQSFCAKCFQNEKTTRHTRRRVAQKEKGVKNAHYFSTPMPKPQAKSKRESMPKNSIFNFPPFHKFPHIHHSTLF